MSERRPLSSFQAGDYDHPPASITLTGDISTRLDRLRRRFERHREESRAESEAARNQRWESRVQAQTSRRRRLRPSDGHSPTFEDRPYGASDDSLDEEEYRPRAIKRRKLDHLSSLPEQKAHTYGRYGQVESGRLKLDLHSCDGEVHDERGSIYYGPSNILKHDQSVYCSKRSECSIILQHHDMTPFCLEKLYIMAPKNGFTAAVREGIANIAMSIDELKKYTDGRPLTDYLGGPASPPPEDRDEEHLTLLESLHDPEVSGQLTQRPFSPAMWAERERVHERSRRLLTDELARSRPRPTMRTLPPVDLLDHDHEGARARRGRVHTEDEPTVSLTESGVKVTMSCEEDISFPEEPTTAAVLADRSRRMRHAHMDEDNIHGWDQRFRTAYSRLRRGIRTEAQRSGAVTPTGTVGQNHKQSGVVRTRFQITETNNVVTLKFDPPVSGTCILLQLQTPITGRNIDIQTVVACGYAGPRFFPAVQFV